MKRSLTLFAVVLLCSSTLALGQQWSEDQSEVWEAVNTLWEAMMQDVDTHYSLIDEDYRGWSVNSVVPVTKEQVRPWLEWLSKTEKWVFYNIQPLAIDVYDDIAIVFYTYQGIVETADGPDRMETGKWTDIYRKKGGRWLLLADSGGAD